MVYYLIMCRSLTYAQRSARVLERSGIGARVMRAPGAVAPEGCGYCLKISEKNLADSLVRLKREDLAPKHVFIHTADGEYREVDH